MKPFLLLLFWLLSDILMAQQPWQLLWEVPGVSSLQTQSLVTGGSGLGQILDLDHDGIAEVINIKKTGVDTIIKIRFSVPGQVGTFSVSGVFNDTIYWAATIPGAESSPLNDMLWVQQGTNGIIGILIGVLDLINADIHNYNPLSGLGGLQYQVLGLKDYNNDGLLEILILDENFNLQLYGPPDD